MYRLTEGKGIVVCDMTLQEHYFELDIYPIDVNQYFKDKTLYRQESLNKSDCISLHNDIFKYM